MLTDHAPRPRRLYPAEVSALFAMLAVLAVVAAAALRPVQCWDFGWQLAEGRQMIATGHVAASTLNAFGTPAPRPINDYIPYEIVFRFLYDYTGWPLIFFGFAALFLFPCLWIGGSYLRYRSLPRLTDAVIVLLAFALTATRMQHRPEAVALVLAFLLFQLLGRLKPGPVSLRTGGSLFLLLAAWSNVHSSFLFGLAAVAAWTGQQFLRSCLENGPRIPASALLPFFLALLGSGCTVYGPERLLFPFELHGDFWGAATSVEMWPASPLMLAGGALLLTLAIFPLRTIPRESRPDWLFLTAAGLLGLTMHSARFITFFSVAILALLALAIPQRRLQTAGVWRSRLETGAGLGLALCCLLLLASRLPQILSPVAGGWYQRGYFAEAALRFIAARESNPVRVLCPLNTASLAQAHPEFHVVPLLDSGTHRFHHDVVRYHFYLSQSPEALALVLQELQVRYLIIDFLNAPAAAVASCLPGWRPVYGDRDCLVYARPTKKPAGKPPLPLEQPGRYSATVTFFLGLPSLSPEENLTAWASLDSSWLDDPSISFLNWWLQQLPDSLVENFLRTFPPSGMNPDSIPFRILLQLRCGQNGEAARLAETWQAGSSLAGIQLVRAQALLSAGHRDEAAMALKKIFPRPEYSMAYAGLLYQAEGTVPSSSLIWSAETAGFMQAYSRTLNTNELPTSAAP